MGIEGAKGDTRAGRVLGHPVAYAATTMLLIILYGWTFFANPGRPAPADDPAFTAWRTEALLVDPPDTVMRIEGPEGMHSTGYRVTTSVIAGLLRRILGVHSLTPTAILAVGCRVVIALLLAGLAYRHLRDPLAWHVVALGSGSVLLTPVFGGYTDNMIALSFVTASLYLIEDTRTSWFARVAFGGLLTMAGLTHPTTFTIFCGALVLVAGVRVVSVRKREFSEVIAAAVAAGIVVAVWTFGIWGPDAEFKEAALPPPGSVAFFRDRLGDWLGAIGIASAALVAWGIGGLYAHRTEYRELTRLSFAWLLPVLGLLGAATAFAYPYYRFLNATLAWVLLLGLGGYFAFRYSQRKMWLAAIVGVALALAIGSNYWRGLTGPEWSDVAEGWIAPDEKRDLEALRSYLANVTPGDVIFVVDDDRAGVRLYGFVKRAGNVSRYAVPPELQDRAAVYLGSVQNLMRNRVTRRDDYYTQLSDATLEEIDGIDEDDVVVLPEVFNEAGSNAGYFDGLRLPSVVHVVDGRVEEGADPVPLPEAGPLVADSAGWWRIVVGAVLLLLPGLALARSLHRDSLVAAAGFSVATGTALIAGVAIVVLAITNEPLTPGVAWGSAAICVAISGGVALWPLKARFRPAVGRA